jgi:hypothetical protein
MHVDDFVDGSLTVIRARDIALAADNSARNFCACSLFLPYPAATVAP